MTRHLRIDRIHATSRNKGFLGPEKPVAMKFEIRELFFDRILFFILIIIKLLLLKVKTFFLKKRSKNVLKIISMS